MNAISHPAPLAQDPAHLHLAAVAMAYTVRSGSLSYMEAAGSLALAAIHEGVLDRMNDRQFLALRDRLERRLVEATLELDFRSAEVIRKAIHRSVTERRSREQILLMADVANSLLGHAVRGEPREHAVLPRLPDQAVQEICRQEVRKAVQDPEAPHAG